MAMAKFRIAPPLCCSLETRWVCTTCTYRLCEGCVNSSNEQEWKYVANIKTLTCKGCDGPGAWVAIYNYRV